MGKSIVGTLKFQKQEPDGFDHVAFGQKIEDAILSGRKTNKFTKKETFSPSTIGYGHGNCARYWYIAFTGTEFNDTFTAQGIANMDNGSAAHDRIQKVLNKTGHLVESETEIKNEDPPIRGYIDAVLEWEGNQVIAEIKTAKQEIYSIRQSSMKPPGNHLLQLLIYMKVRQSKYGVFIYENKNDQELCLIPITVNDRYIKIVDELFDWLRTVRKAYDEEQLPNRPFTKSKPACKGCPVFDTCWKQLDDGENIIEEYTPPK